MRNSMYLLLGTILVLAACSKEEITNSVLPEGAIGFSEGVLTRGTPIESADGILSMGVFCGITDGDFTMWSSPNNYMDNIHVSRPNSSTAFTYPQLMYWPVAAGKKLSFFAYAPHHSVLSGGTLTFTTSGGAPALSYTVPVNVAQQPDLMVAVPKTNLTKLTAGGAIAFSMKHTLASVGFRIAGQGETVSAIKISGISVSGMLPMDGSGAIQWTALSTPTIAEYTAGINEYAAGSGLTDIMQGNGYLMMIPQTTGENTKVIVTVDNEDREVSLSGKTWEPGKKYTYDLNIQSEEDGGLVINQRILTLYRTLVKNVANFHPFNTDGNDGFFARFGGYYSPGTTTMTGSYTIQVESGHNDEKVSYTKVKGYCRNLREGGYDDWRLPTHIELVAMWDKARGGNDNATDGESASSIFGAKFKAGQDSWYWSCSGNMATDQYHSGVNFFSGDLDTVNDTQSVEAHEVRCVRDV